MIITSNQVWKSHPRIRDLTIIQYGIRETLTGYGISLPPGKPDSAKKRDREIERC